MKNEQELIVLKGLPASGKSTFAKTWVNEKPKERVRVNRDDIRHMLGKYWVPSREKLITDMENSIIHYALISGFSVISDNTNFRHSYDEDWLDIRGLSGFNIKITEKFFNTPVTVCITRDNHRGVSSGHVGSEVILGMYDKYFNQLDDIVLTTNQRKQLTSKKKYDPRLQVTPLGRNTLPSCYIFDLDGTISLMDGRSPYNGESCKSDKPNWPVIDTLENLANVSTTIFIFSGRNGESEEQTKLWLRDHDIPYDHLAMRKPGDNRKDSIIKQEMYEEFVKDKYYVAGIFDDRNMVVDHWRSLDLPCYQVYPGDF